MHTTKKPQNKTSKKKPKQTNETSKQTKERRFILRKQFWLETFGFTRATNQHCGYTEAALSS